jgi:hypothetical protein
MPSSEGMVFHGLAWSVLSTVESMKLASLFERRLFRWICFFIALLPSLALAHPGHYHPDETDEFDFFRTTFFHSHGALDYVLAGVALGSVGLALMLKKRSSRLGALALAVVSVAVFPFLS